MAKARQAAKVGVLRCKLYAPCTQSGMQQDFLTFIRVSSCTAYLILDDGNALAMTFGQQIIQQSCLAGAQKASDDLQKQTHHRFEA